MTDLNKKEIMKFILSHKEINMPNETMYKLLEYFEAMAHFYAIIPLQKVYEILTVNYSENVIEEEFYELTGTLHKDPIGYYYIDSHDEVYDQSKRVFRGRGN